jgi:hypothetical protein
MKQTSIPTGRKYLYFYILVLLVTIAVVFYRPNPAGKSQKPIRAAEVNKLSNTLFQ